MVSTQDSPTKIEIQFAKCECCGLTEECTPQYIEMIRERYMGKWVCGLCSEAVKDEVIRSRRIITTEEALNRHLNVCRKFRSSSPPVAGEIAGDLITAFRHILRRSLECPRGGLRSTPASPTRGSSGEKRPVLSRSESCFPQLWDRDLFGSTKSEWNRIRKERGTMGFFVSIVQNWDADCLNEKIISQKKNEERDWEMIMSVKVDDLTM